MTVAERVKTCFERIEKAAAAAGRRGSEITLVAASKTKPASDIREAISAGIAHIGENRAQEISEKLPQGAYSGAQLHYIGTLQSNKINALVGVCSLIESVSDEHSLALISKRAETLGKTQDVLIEVNIGSEAGKSGAAPELLPQILESAANFPYVRVLGLMSVPPAGGSNNEISLNFSKIRNLFIDIGAKKYDNVIMSILSMGMSDSFEAAIAEGATAVRLGTAIFGKR